MAGKTLLQHLLASYALAAGSGYPQQAPRHAAPTPRHGRTGCPAVTL